MILNQQWVDDCDIVFVSESCWDIAIIKIPETHVLNGFLPYLPLRTRGELYVILVCVLGMCVVTWHGHLTNPLILVHLTESAPNLL